MKKRILLCEDNQLLNKSHVVLLESHGHVVLNFDTADKALELGTEVFETTDVLLTDVEMPGTNGVELALYVKEKYPAISIIIMSGHSVDREILAQVDAIFYPKPFSFSKMIEKINQFGPIASLAF